MLQLNHKILQRIGRKDSENAEKPLKTLELLPIGSTQCDGLKRSKFVHNAVTQAESYWGDNEE